MKGKIYAYNTHYEIVDYNLKDCPKLEFDLSIYDDVYHRQEPKFYYDSEKKVLLIPKGYDFNLLQEYFKTFIDDIDTTSSKKKVTFSMELPPRNAIQKEAVRFLSGKNEYATFKDEHQLVLSMPPGEGKTYCAISAASLLGHRTIVIVNTVDLKRQWIEDFLAYTNIPTNYVRDLHSSDMTKVMENNKRIQREFKGVVAFVVTHATIQSFMRKHGERALGELFDKLQIGVKIFDEAHQNTDNTLLIDYMTNVWKTIYMSATFARSDYSDNKVFQKSFNMVHKLRLESTTRRHMIYIPYIYKTKPSAIVRESVRGIKGFNKYKYTEYEMSCGAFREILQKLLYFFIDKHQIEGKIAILSAKKESCDELLKIVQELYPAYKACSHHTGNRTENFKDYGIICSTPKKIGTGEDIPGLRIVINLEPGRSTVNAAQISGRLREYSEDKDTYYVELVDKAFRNVYDMYMTRRNFLVTVAKEIKTIDTTVIRY